MSTSGAMSWGAPLSAANNYNYSPRDDYFQTGIVGTESISLSTGTEKNQTYASAAAVNSKGIVPNNKYNRYNFTVRNTTTFLDDKMTLDFGASYILQNDQNMTNQGTYNNPLVGAYLFPRSNDWSDISMYERYDAARKIYTQYWPVGDEGMVMQNPYWINYRNLRQNKKDRYMLNAGLSYKILDWLTVSGRVRLDNSNNDYTEKFYASTNTQLTESSSRGLYGITKTQDKQLYADFLVSINKYFGEDWSLQANVGGSFSDIRSDAMKTRGPIADGGDAFSGEPVGLTNYFAIQNLSASKTQRLQEGWREQTQSLFASAELGYKNTYFLTLTGRNDWSSTIIKGNNSYFYPSVSLSAMLDQYISLPSWMDYLKINGAWAQVSSDLDPYSLYATYSKGILYGSTPSVTYQSDLLNANILPQKTTSYEIGLSTSFLRNRLGLDVTYYHMIDKNSIIQLPISVASGFNNRYVNGNTYTTNGAELIITATPIQSKKFTWNLSTNWSTNIRKLTEIYGGQEKYGDLKLGDRADAMYATEWEKTPDGQLILDSNGMPTQSAFKSYIGNQDPDVRFGLQNTFKFDHFTVNVDMDGAIGGTLISTTTQKMWWGGKHPKSTMYRQEEYENGGKPIYVPEGVNIVSGEVTYDVNGNIISDTRVYKKNETAVNIQTWAQNYPYRAVVRTSESELFANTFSRSFLKLSRVAVSYDFSHLIHSNSIKGLEVTLYGNNLAVLKKTPYLDPDFGASDSDLQDPSARYIGVSANITF